MANSISWGSVYSVSWWGNTNEANGWGIVYPVVAGAFTADTNSYTADTSTKTADQTVL